MGTDVLQRFRDGVAAKRFTLTELAKLSGVPLATLSDMSDEDWRPQIFDRLEKLRTALDQIEGEGGHPDNDAAQSKSPNATEAA